MELNRLSLKFGKTGKTVGYQTNFFYTFLKICSWNHQSNLTSPHAVSVETVDEYYLSYLCGRREDSQSVSMQMFRPSSSHVRIMVIPAFNITSPPT